MTDPVYLVVPTVTLRPNDYNPNVMSDEDYAKALESIDRFGFIDPITVRPYSGDGVEMYEIVDGENRWRAAKDKGLVSVPIILIEVSDDDARELTIILNELRGRPDEGRLATLVRGLAERRPMAELEKVLPFRRQQLAAMVAERQAAIDWDSLNRPLPPPAPPAGDPPKERWVERVYRLPVSAAEVVDGAIARLRENEGIDEPWRALELIAAEFLAGAH